MGEMGKHRVSMGENPALAHQRDQPAASAPSELKTRPTLTVPCLRPVLVRGPPASRLENLPAWKLYVETRPAWHFGRCGHSGGPPSTVAAPEHLAARSDSVFTPYLSENAVVVANAFWSCACDGAPKVRPRLSPRDLRLVIVVSSCGEDGSFVFLPSTLPARNVARVAAYSGTTSRSPFSRA